MASAGFTVTAPADNAHRLNAVDAIATFTVCMTYSKTWGVTHLSRRWLTIGLRWACLLLTDNWRAELRPDSLRDRPVGLCSQHGARGCVLLRQGLYSFSAAQRRRRREPCS